MEKKHFYKTSRFGFFVILFLCILSTTHAQSNKSKLDSIRYFEIDSVTKEFSFRLDRFLTDDELKVRVDSITKKEFLLPWQKRNIRTGFHGQVNFPYYIELRNNKIIPERVIHMICDSNLILKNDFFNHKIYFNQCRNLDPKIHFDQLKYLYYTELIYMNCIFQGSDISDYFVLSKSVKSLYIENCIYKGSLTNLLKKNQLEIFNRTNCYKDFSAEESYALMNATKLKYLSLIGNQTEIPLDLSKLLKLESVCLRNMNLKVPPNGIFDLPFLDRLDLSGNRLAKINVDFRKKHYSSDYKIDTFTQSNRTSKRTGKERGIKKYFWQYMNDTSYLKLSDTLTPLIYKTGIFSLSFINLSDNCLTDNSIDLRGCKAQEIYLQQNFFNKPPKGIYSLPKTTTVYLDKNLKSKINIRRLKCKVEYM